MKQFQDSVSDDVRFINYIFSFFCFISPIIICSWLFYQLLIISLPMNYSTILLMILGSLMIFFILFIIGISVYPKRSFYWKIYDDSIEFNYFFFGFSRNIRIVYSDIREIRYNYKISTTIVIQIKKDCLVKGIFFPPLEFYDIHLGKCNIDDYNEILSYLRKKHIKFIKEDEPVV